MIRDVLVVGPIQANCHLLGCPATRAGLILDPGDDPDEIARRIERHGLKPAYYLHTHGHIDHVGATAALKERFGGEILLHRADLFLYEHAREHAQAYGIDIPPTLPVDRFIADGEVLVWGEMRGTILHTPGHSPGGICLRVPGACMNAGEPAAAPGGRPPGRGGASGAGAPSPDWVFTGDTLFMGSVGRTDLPGGSWALLLRSIREKLLPLPDECVVASGHGPLSTIGEERRRNPFLQAGAEFAEGD